MNDSILKSVKKLLGLADDYTVFDMDVILHINSVFATLQQLGVGPDEAFFIEDGSATWDQFLGDIKNINSVKTYVYLRVRLLFDPPTTSFAISAMQEQVREHEWRLKVAADRTALNLTPANATVWELDNHGNFPPEAEPGDVGFDPLTGNAWRKV